MRIEHPPTPKQVRSNTATATTHAATTHAATHASGKHLQQRLQLGDGQLLQQLELLHCHRHTRTVGCVHRCAWLHVGRGRRTEQVDVPRHGHRISMRMRMRTLCRRRRRRRSVAASSSSFSFVLVCICICIFIFSARRVQVLPSREGAHVVKGAAVTVCHTAMPTSGAGAGTHVTPHVSEVCVLAELVVGVRIKVVGVAAVAVAVAVAICVGAACGTRKDDHNNNQHNGTLRVTWMCKQQQQQQPTQPNPTQPNQTKPNQSSQPTSQRTPTRHRPSCCGAGGDQTAASRGV